METYFKWETAYLLYREPARLFFVHLQVDLIALKTELVMNFIIINLL